MLIRAVVGNQIKMLNTAAKQSPGKDANTFMLIKRGKDGEEMAADRLSQQLRVEREMRGRERKWKNVKKKKVEN